MVLVDHVIVKLLSSRAGVAFIESLWLCNEYQQQHQEAFQALTSILTRGKYTSSPKAWLHRRGVVAIFAQLAAVDLDLDPAPQRDAKNEDNPVNAPVNVSKHSLVKARIPSRVSPLSLAKGMAELGERWKLMEADDIMSVALVIQSASQDGLIGKEEFLEFAERIGTLSRTMEYKNNPSDALEKLYSDMVEKKRESAAAEFFAEWLSEDTSPAAAAVSGDGNMSDSGGASGSSGNFFYGAEGSKFYKNARTLKTIQYQLEEMCAQARVNGMKPLISLEQLKKKVKERGLAGGSSGSGNGGVPHDILGRFLEGMGASVSARERDGEREGGGGGTAATATATVERGSSSSSSSPYSFFSDLMGSSTGGGEHVSLYAAGYDNIYTDGGEGTTRDAIQSPSDTLPTFRYEEYTASDSDAGAALRELQNNSAFLAQRIATQSQSSEFEAALRQFQSLGGGGSHYPPDGGYNYPPGGGGAGVEGGGLSTVFSSIDAGTPSRPSNAAITNTNTITNAAAITASGTPAAHPSEEELDIAQRLKGLTVDTSWDRTRGAVVMSPMTEASSTPRHSPRSVSVSVSGAAAANGLLASASTPRSSSNSSSRSSGSTLNNSAASTSSNTTSEKKANLSIFKSPRLKTRVALRKSPSDRLPVRVSPCNGSGHVSKPVVTRSQKNKDAAESAIVNKKSFKH
jgi:hypothetical protein